MNKLLVSDFWTAFLAGMSPGNLAAGFVFAFIGIALSLLVQTTKRDPMSPRSPTHFSWSFLWCDNSMRILKSALTAVIVIFLSLRFAKNLIGTEATMFYALGIGFGIDKAIEKIRNKINS